MLRWPLLIVLLTPLSVAHAQPDLSGIWMLLGLAKDEPVELTPAGQAIQEGYDLLEDDPSLYCIPASSARVWANPNVRIAFDQGDDYLLIVYEFYDLRRRIPLGADAEYESRPSTRNIGGTLFPEMGTSIARYEGDRLIIETRGHAAGYLRTSRGLPQAPTTTSVEELWIERDTLRLRQTYTDETLFVEPFVSEYAFQRTGETEVPFYECTEADYGWFEELNAPGNETQP